MKGVSAVIATIMMLVITIALAGMAYMFISASFSAQTGKIVQIDEGATYCSGTSIYIYIKNIGTTDFMAADVNILKQGQPAAPCAASGTVTAGGMAVACNAYTGTPGSNTMVVTANKAAGPSNTVRATVYC